jgi:regulator of sigma E protease
MLGLGSTGTVFLIILGLIVLVIVHEAGHFLAARAVGARATKFYVGFGPPLVRFRRGDTEYGIAAIPAGGYVKIPGMLRPQKADLYRLEDAAKELEERLEAGESNVLESARERIGGRLAEGDYDAASREARATVAVVADLGDRLHPRTAALATTELERIGDDAGPGAFWRLSIPRRIIVLAAGPGMNLLAAVVILSAHLMLGVGDYKVTTRVDSVVASSPAAASGLRAGDRIVSVDGRKAATSVDVSDVIQSAGKAGSAVRLTVLRDGRSVVLRPAVPKRDAATGTPRLGLQFGVDRIGTTRLGPVSAARRSVGLSWGIVRDSVTGLASTFTGNRKNLGTVVGVVAEAQAPVQEGSGPEVFAFVSIALAVFNLLPFLPLDGGHILFALIERFRRSPIPRVAFERYSVFGIVLMLMIFAVGLTNDVGRITGP